MQGHLNRRVHSLSRHLGHLPARCKMRNFVDDFLTDITAGMMTGLKYLLALVIVATLLFLATGCSTLSVSTPDGKASYTRIGNQDISGLRFERDNLGMMRITLDKQSSDSNVLDLIRQLVTK